MSKKILSLMIVLVFVFVSAACSTEKKESEEYFFEDDSFIEDFDGVDEREMSDFEYTMANTVASDAYGRQVLTYGDRIGNRDVGMFYFVWLGQHPESTTGIYDITELQLNRPDDLWNASGTKYSPAGKFHFWGEPLYGYYNNLDPWVVDKQMQMLITMGLDFLGVDATNGVAYIEVYKLIFEILDKYQKQGFDVPKITFLVNTNTVDTLTELYDHFYKQGCEYSYPNLLYCPNQKPFISADLRQMGDSEKELLEFFEIRQMQWPNEDMMDEAFSWMSFDYPQYNHNGDMSVSVAQHVTGIMSDVNGSRGRGYDAVSGKNTAEGVDKGANLRGQWQTVFDSLKTDKPVKRVFVTGYNEWIALKFPLNGTESSVHFVDLFNKGFSRDIEPMKGGYGDNYYLLSMAMSRRYRYEKGMRYKIPKIEIDFSGDDAQWDEVRRYMDFKGDTFERNFAGAHRSVHYSDQSNRNDIVSTQVAHDSQNLYIRVTTAEDITKHEAGDLNWMNVWIGSGENEKFGDFNYVINRTPGGSNKTSVERCRGGYSWEKTGEADCVISGNTMKIKIPLSMIEVNAEQPCVRVKVSDNVLHLDEDIMNFYLYGDSAPLGRLSYAYGV